VDNILQHLVVLNLHIISTCSGELICERDARVQWYTHQGFDFIHLVNEDWLNDVFCCNAPFFVYLNQSISCCDKCFLVVTAEALFSSSLTWELQILKVGKGQVEPEVVSMRTVLVKLQQEEKVLQWLLIPDVQNSELGRKQELDFCPRHNLICICDTSISVYKVDLTLPEPKSTGTDSLQSCSNITFNSTCGRV